MNLKTITAVFAAFGLSMASADQIKMANGSVIVGEVLQVFGGKVKVKTDFAGELTIDSAKVASIATDKNVNVALPDGKVAGKMTEAGLQGSGTTVTPVDIKTVTAIWPDGSVDPTLPKQRKWSYEIGLDINGKTGNTEKLTYGGSAKAALTGPQDKLLLYLRGKHARENHLTNEKEIIGGADYERRIAETKHSWYARSEYEYDKYNDLDPAWTSAAGYGFYMLDKDDVKIRLRLGLSYVYKDYISDKETDSSVGLDANYHHEIKLKKLSVFDNFASFVTDVTYTPAFEDLNDYRLLHESALSLPLGGSKYWSIRIGMTNDYYNRVAEDKKHMDTTYFTKIILTWD